MRTYNAKPGEVERRWYVVDADGQTLGRLATRIADTLRGKGKAQYTPHVDTGDFVVVVNADKVRVTGNKLDQKRYYRHSGYPGGLRLPHQRHDTRQHALCAQSGRTILDASKNVDRAPHYAIASTALNANRLARQQLNKLKVYAGPNHPHTAQNPELLRGTEDA